MLTMSNSFLHTRTAITEIYKKSNFTSVDAELRLHFVAKGEQFDHEKKFIKFLLSVARKSIVVLS